MPNKRFTVTHSSPLDDEEAAPVAAGVVAIDDALQVEVVSAEPDFAEDLQLAAEMLNNSDNFLVHADPPNRTSRAIHKRVVPRSDASAREALFTVLREKYGFELTPSG